MGIKMVFAPKERRLRQVSKYAFGGSSSSITSREGELLVLMVVGTASSDGGGISGVLFVSVQFSVLSLLSRVQVLHTPTRILVAYTHTHTHIFFHPPTD